MQKILKFFIWLCFTAAIGALVLGALSSCSTTKKSAYKEQAQSDSTGKSHAVVDSAEKKETNAQKETSTETTFEDWFFTDESWLKASVKPSDVRPDTVETDALRIIASLNDNGEIDLDVYQKQQKARGKGTTKTQTKEKTQEKTESQHHSEVKQKATVQHASTKVEKHKEKKSAPVWISIAVVIVILLALVFGARFLIKRI